MRPLGPRDFVHWVPVDVIVQIQPLAERPEDAVYLVARSRPCARPLVESCADGVAADVVRDRIPWQVPEEADEMAEVVVPRTRRPILASHVANELVERTIKSFHCVARRPS